MIVDVLAASGTTEPMDKNNAYLVLFGVVAVLVLAYWISLHVHPYTKCGVCKGGARHRGSMFGHSFRLCRRCGGTGRKARLGRRIFIRDS